MLKNLRNALSLLLIFSFSTTLLGNETAKKYFPATLGSHWVYEDQDGNELTRRAVEGEEIAGEIYHAFNYEPAFENWENYEYYVHPTLFKIDEKGIKFIVDDAVEKTYKERLTNELKNSIELGSAPPGFNPKFDIDVEIEAQNNFYFLSTPVTLNEEWKSMRIKPTIKITMNFENPETDAELAGMSQGTIIYFTIMETGIITAKETVETPAGTFKDCLKIEYRTETVMPSLPGPGGDGPKASESVSTVWLAPNVGIVKFYQETETPFLSDFQGTATTTQVKTLALKKYEIKSNASETE